MAENYLDKSSERKNMGKKFSCGKTAESRENLSLHSTSVSGFLQLLVRYPGKPPEILLFTLTTKIQNNISTPCNYSNLM